MENWFPTAYTNSRRRSLTNKTFWSNSNISNTHFVNTLFLVFCSSTPMTSSRTLELTKFLGLRFNLNWLRCKQKTQVTRHFSMPFTKIYISPFKRQTLTIRCWSPNDIFPHNMKKYRQNQMMTNNHPTIVAPRKKFSREERKPLDVTSNIQTNATNRQSCNGRLRTKVQFNLDNFTSDLDFSLKN